MTELPRETGSNVHNRYDGLCVERTVGIAILNAVCETCRANRAEKAMASTPRYPREIGT